MSRLVYLAATLLVIPAPVVAQIVFEDDAPPPKTTPTNVEPTPANRAKSDLDKVECRNEDPTGTRLNRHMVCLTKAQWFAYDATFKEWTQHIQALASIGSGG